MPLTMVLHITSIGCMYIRMCVRVCVCMYSLPIGGPVNNREHWGLLQYSGY